MSRTARRTLAFEAMEGRLLLSSGIGHRAHCHHAAPAVVRRQKAAVTHVMLTGSLAGIPFGTVTQSGILVSSFALTGKAQSLGKVGAALDLTHAVIEPGRQPDLGNATLSLANRRGSVQVKMASSPSNRYIFIVTGGTGAYASAYGSGTALITYNQKLHEYQIAVRSSQH